MKYLKTYMLFICLMALITGSCKKDDRKSSVATQPVDFYLFLNEPSNVALNAIGGWIYVNNQGTKGIIVYRASTSDFTALERNCTYDPGESCSIVEIISGISAIDSCCSSRFSIFDGSIINGPATQPLYRYSTQLNGSTLHVYD